HLELTGVTTVDALSAITTLSSFSIRSIRMALVADRTIGGREGDTPMQSSVSIGRVAGIRIGIHYTWLFAFLLIAWSLAASYYPDDIPGLSTTLYWFMGIVSALLLFASVLIHELTHSLVARRLGLTVDSITLFIFGGVSNLTTEPSTARNEFLVAVVGPISSLVLAGLFWLVARTIP